MLGPLITEEELAGARDWGIVLAGGPIGALLAGLIALRIRPKRPLVVAFAIWTVPALPLLALTGPLPAPVLALVFGLSVGSVELGNVLWNTVVQQRIPEHALSRVNSYDFAVSIIFMPLGYTLAAPVAEQIGADTTLVLAAAVAATGNLAALLVPSIRGITRAPAPAPAQPMST